ncbi:MAG: zinc-ribbon domain-containing protein [Acidobacteriota bacterium]
MAFCGKCGTSMADGVAFCPKCGAPVGAAPGTPAGAPFGTAPGMPQAAPMTGPMAPASSGLTENVAGLLCYVLGWLTGLIFLLVDKRPFVRFHAAQSIVVFGALTILRIVLTFFFLGGYSFGLFWFWSLISLMVTLAFFVCWILLMVMAYQGKWFEVPIAAGIAKSIAGSSKV